ncbi:MAG: tRNA pseudouridine(38-40) synthase TruA [Actinobacteria bacterium]|nr:tRNA pseudouridine(38-40) synthase TruA [Actinomycetota bacterium]
MSKSLIAITDGGLTRYRATIAYDGKEFKGWGFQPDQRTVQGEVEVAIAQVLRLPEMPVQCAGRTDAGVHASGQVIHFDLPGKLLIEPDDLAYKINSILPEDVAVRSIAETTADFDARFAALSRSYVYLVYQGNPNPLLRDRAHRSWLPLDVEVMHDASQVLLGLHDFAGFCRKREGGTTIRTLLKFDWHVTDEGLIQADVTADAFCHSMVRGLVGALLSIGEGKRDKNWLAEYLEQRERSSGLFIAPAHGLTLTHVEYPSEAEFASRVEQTLNMRPDLVAAATECSEG